MAAPDRHVWLTQGMARALGVRLSDALATGGLDGKRLPAMLDRCAACPHAQSCVGWLAVQQAQACTAPDYCRNKSDFDQLRAAS